jgi:hypothetical protein
MTHVLLALSLLLGVARVPVITLERTVCYGTCPAYKLTIFDDGTVMFEGKEFVKHSGTHTGQISKSDLDKLIDEFEKVDYVNLADNYVDDPKNCPEQWTDNPTAITSLDWQGKKKTIRHYYGCRGAKVLEQLTALENKIDEVVNTNRWIK